MAAWNFRFPQLGMGFRSSTMQPQKSKSRATYRRESGQGQYGTQIVNTLTVRLSISVRRCA
jgi:hypothetical protein